MFTLQTQVTLDGFMAGPEGEMDWIEFDWSDDLTAYVDSLSEGVDTLVLGRNLAEGFIPHWASQPEHEPQESIDFMNNTPKVVITRTLDESKWDNTEVAKGPVEETIARLQGEGRTMLAFGGGELVASLVEQGLLDELNLFVNPTAIGAGMPVFGKGSAHYALAEARRFECGIVLLRLTKRA